MAQKSTKTVLETKEKFSFLSLMQNIGKSLVFPIATLPAAALLLRVGVFIQSFGAVDGTGWEQFAYWFGFIMSTPGAAVFDNLPIIFGIGVAFGFAKENRGEVALVGAIAYFALIALAQNEGSLSTLVYGHADVGVSSVQVSVKITDQDAFDAWYSVQANANALDSITSQSWDSLASAQAAFDATGVGQIDGAELTSSMGNSGLLYLNVFDQETGMLLSSTWLMNFGVFGGILTGLSSALIYNKFSEVRLHPALGFFSGRRFVPIITLFIMIVISFAMAILWPWVNIGLIWFSKLIAQVPAFGAGVYAFANRLLIPFGLHQVLNTYFWFQAPIVSEAGNQILLWNGTTYAPVLGDINAFADITNDSYWMINNTEYVLEFGTLGTNAHLYAAQFGTSMIDGTFEADTSKDELALLQGANIGMYQAGFFPTMMFGLPAVAIAMAIRAEDEHKKQVWAFMIAGSVVAFLTGITEPLEFSFMFISPIIYVVYSALTGVYALLVVLLGISNGFGFSAGAIDWFISLMGGGIGVLSRAGLWANLELLAIGVLAAVVNFFVVYLLIGKFNIATPGRNGNITGLTGNDDEPTKGGTASKNEKLTKMAKDTIDFIGVENIEKVDNCITRVRLTVKDNSKYDDSGAVKIGYTGVIKVGKKAYQMIIGPDSEVIANEMKRLISDGYGKKASKEKNSTTKEKSNTIKPKETQPKKEVKTTTKK